MLTDLAIKINIKDLPAYRVMEILLGGKATTQQTACAEVGISVDTFSRALKKHPELGLMYSDYKSKLTSGLLMLLEDFHGAEEVFARKLIETLRNEQANMQTQVMAHNKLSEMFARQLKEHGIGSLAAEKNAGALENEAAEMLVRRLQGAALTPAVSKITVEFESNSVVDGSLIPDEAEAEPAEPE